MSKKSFVVTLVLSVVVWLVSAVTQGILGTLLNFNFLNFQGCQVTGYPLGLCVDSLSKAFGYYIINIMFWFIILLMIRKFFSRLMRK